MLGDDIASVLADLRAQDESLMITPCTIRRITGVHPDPVTGTDITRWATIWQGRCQLVARDVEAAPEDIPGTAVLVLRNLIKLPVGAGPFEVGDVVEVPATKGPVRQLRIAGTNVETWQTAQRLPIEEIA